MEYKQGGLTEISVKLTTSGKYVWTITSSFDTLKYEEGITILKEIENKLKEKFPNYPIPGSGRITSLDED